MLNVSSPSPLYDDQASSNISIDTNNKKNTSMFGVNQPSARPTLNNNGEDVSNDIVFEENKNNKITYKFKIILLGSISVGKTAILERYISNKFNDAYQCTMRCEFKTKCLNINNSSQAKLEIWDTVGDEKFRSITKQYYKNADGILLIYDITSRKSFDSLVSWTKEIRDNAPGDAVLYLVGNKSDLTKERVISCQEGTNKAEELGMLFIEVSAKEGDNIHMMFGNISEAMMQINENKPQTNNNQINLNQSPENIKEDANEAKKKKACC